MKYKPFIIGFQKAGGKEYRITVMAESGTQAVRIASNKLSDKLGEGDRRRLNNIRSLLLGFLSFCTRKSN